MIQRLYIMQDVVSGAFGSPFLASSDNVVRRDMMRVASDPLVPVQYVRDTIVLCFGFFNGDVTSPRFEMFDVPVTVLRGDSDEFKNLRRQAVDETVFDND